MAMSHFIEPEAIAISAPPLEMIASTPREVAITDSIDRLVNLLKTGTMTNPPPTPSNPERNPAVEPAIIMSLAHGKVQINFPLDSCKVHSASLLDLED